MKILFLYTKRMLAANKARTAVTFAGIVLSFALLTAVLTGTSSLFHFFSEYMKMRDGDYYGVIYNCDEEDEARLAQSEEVTQSCRMGIVGVAEKGFGIEHELSLSNRVYVAIGSVDADFFATMGVRLIEGRLPENDSEVIIPQMMTTAGKEFHVGDTITWQIGKRIGSDGRVIQHQEQRIEDRSSADFCEEETIQVEQTKTYTIVGVSTNPGYQKFAEPCYLVLTTGVQTTISDIYLKTKSIDDTSDFIAKNFGDHQSKINETLLRYFGQGVSDIRYMLFGMCAVLMVVVAIASIALIYNSFSISLTERTRQFGLFKSIGATRFQVIVSVFLEAGFLAVSAIPAGLLIGCVGVSCVFRLLKNSFDAMINSNGVAYVGSISMTFYTQVWYLVVAAVAGIITILVSAMVPALRAGRISPIEAIRQTNDIKDSKFARNIRGRGILGTVFGVGGLIAHRNAKRNKKSYRAISFSLAICLFLFLGGGGFIYYMRLGMKGLNVPYYYNYHIKFNSIYNDTFDQEYLTQEFREKLVSQLRTSSSVSDAVYIRKANLQIAMDESNLTDVGKLAVGEYIVDGQMHYRDQVYFVEDTEYEAYLKQLGLNPEEYLRAENPKLLILNAVKGAADFDDGRRRFYEGAMFKDSSELTEISIMEQKKIGDASYAYPDPEDPSMMIYLVGDGRTAQSDDDFKKFKVPVEESIAKLQFEVGATVNAEDYPYWAWAGKWRLVLPLSAYPEDQIMLLNVQDYAYVKTVDSERALELMTEIRNEYDESFDLGMPPQTDQYEANMMRILNVCLMCFLILIVLISLANIANTITTAVRLRTREYALIKAAGCGKYTFLRMIFAENLSYTLRGFVIGGLMGALANYKSYSYLKYSIYTNKIIPIDLYAVGAAAFVLVMIFSTVYTWRKVKRGNICEELRQEAV